MTSIVEKLAAGPDANTALAVNTGRPAPFANGQSSSAILKAANPTAYAGRLGLAGDEHADNEKHGGPEKAVHQYPIEHYRHWLAHGIAPALLDAPGSFGENITSVGMTEASVCVGDVYLVGNGGTLLQVTQTRLPCWKLGVRFNAPMLPAEVQKTGRTGWHYRVLVEGNIAAGDTFVLADRPNPAWTLARLTHALFVDTLNRDALQQIAQLGALAETLKAIARKRLERSAVEPWNERLTGKRS